MAILSNKDENNKNEDEKSWFKKASFYSVVKKKLMSLCSHVLCGSAVIFVHFPHLWVRTLATGHMAVHWLGKILNSGAESADRAWIHIPWLGVQD
jgi:hypothetical protein